MVKYFLAIDIGASSGTHILGHIDNGKMMLEEIHRFDNGMIKTDNHLCWDLQTLWKEILVGMKKCKDLGKIPESVGIDTWAVDFVLLDRDDTILGPTVAYRDDRTNGMDEKVYQIIKEDSLYARTGIQKQPFNTIYQLMAIKDQHPEYMKAAKSMLMVPDYFHFLLTGLKKNEYTNTTTTQLVNPTTKDWDFELIEALGYNKDIFGEIVLPGSVLGDISQAIQDEVGYTCKVVLPATHDTASAVMAVPTTDKQALYISSGTWSLMGIERMEADCSHQSAQLNFTNEGGYDYRFRYLKNIMGLWMIQSVRNEYNKEYSFAQLCEMASKENIKSIVDCNDPRFIAPPSMTEEVKKVCKETNQQVPESVGEIAAVIYESLGVCYDKTVKEIEMMTAKEFDAIHIVGGGANAQYLNELTARITGKIVLAGPTEATATGNLVAQMIPAGMFKDLHEARQCIKNSFNINQYKF
ncbi:MAG TPA: rhamnulokinase [Epulopiscium sp.]|nr:rhamnulokinase [Candidatus Epulonipiscium sp.]